MLKKRNLGIDGVAGNLGALSHTDGVLQKHTGCAAAVDKAMLGNVGIQTDITIRHRQEAGTKGTTQELLTAVFAVGVHADQGHIHRAAIDAAHTVAQHTGNPQHSLVGPELQLACDGAV